MRCLPQIRRLERRFPAPTPELIVRWGDSKGKPSEIFSTKGWKISFDENNLFTKTGNVPEGFTEDMLQAADPSAERTPLRPAYFFDRLLVYANRPRCAHFCFRRAARRVGAHLPQGSAADSAEELPKLPSPRRGGAVFAVDV